MKGIKFEDLQAMVDFLYRGEANVFQENLESFLAIAEELKLKGLSGLQDESERITESNQSEMTTKPTFKRERPILSQEQSHVASKDKKWPIFAKFAERRATVSTLETTLRQIILKEFALWPL